MLKNNIAFMICLLFLMGCASINETDNVPSWNDKALERVTSDELQQFGSEREFRQYLKSVRKIARAKGTYWWANSGTVQYAQTETDTQSDESKCKDDEECEQDFVVVTGSRIKSSKVNSITNNQKTNVDEGDIVKNFGRFLIVLQDGRLFSVDTVTAADGMKLVDRIDVYYDSKSDTWYDEMLIYDNRIVVTGYSYDMQASELSVLHIDNKGMFTHEATFFISSDDYYDIENYASRLVGDSLILHTPLNLARDGNNWRNITYPTLRKWTKKGGLSKARKMYSATDVYAPIQNALFPVMHAISVCPLGGKNLNCKTTAIVAPGGAEYYVDGNDAYLWIWVGGDEYDEADVQICKADEVIGWENKKSLPGAVYKFQLNKVGKENALKAVFADGYPTNQFSLETNDGEFRAMLEWGLRSCEVDWENDAPVHSKYVEFPISMFRTRPISVRDKNYTALPDIDGYKIENRFTEDHLVYGSRKVWSIYPPDKDDEDAVFPLRNHVVAVPVDTPQSAIKIPIPHNVIRLEPVGRNIIATGYESDVGLSISSIDLRQTPRLADTYKLYGRYESEGRSHAFNANIKENGSGVLGLPTVIREKKRWRWWSYSDTSDVNFLTLDENLKLTDAGRLKASEDPVHEDYECEVSCVDWYGNTRPIFLDGRIFALSATELVEGRLSGGRMVEIGRVNLSEPMESMERRMDKINP